MAEGRCVKNWFELAPVSKIDEWNCWSPSEEIDKNFEGAT